MKPWYQMLVFVALMLASYLGHELVFAIYRSDLLRDNPPASSSTASRVLEQAGRPGEAAVMKTLAARADFAI